MPSSGNNPSPRWILSPDRSRYILAGAPVARAPLPPRPLSIPSTQSTSSTPTIAAVCVTAHQPYVDRGWLAECLASIEAQTQPPALKILCLDDVPAWDSATFDGWTIIRGKWGTPNPARNHAARLAADAGIPWVWYMDADNTAPHTMLQALLKTANSAPANSAIIYPGLQYCDAQLNPTGKTLEPPPYDYAELRRRNYIDTCALWRTDAVVENPWAEDINHWDDWDIACRITRAGWRAVPAPDCPKLNYRNHQDGRWQTHCRHGRDTSAWRVLSYTIIALFAGRRDAFSAWAGAIHSLDLPPDIDILLVDDSGDNQFAVDLRGLVYTLSTRRLPASVIPSPLPSCPDITTEIQRHQRVAALYTDAVRRTTADRIITIEDDVIPPTDAIRRLVNSAFPATGPATGPAAGAVSAVYPSPGAPKCAVASGSPDRWCNMPRLDDIPARPIRIGMVGGGCTIWDGPAFRDTLPLRAYDTPAGLLGWDTYISRALHARGLRILLDGRVRCEHRITQQRRPPK